MIVQKAIDRFIDDRYAQNLGEATIRNYESTLLRFLDPKEQVASITPEILRKRLSAEKLQPTSKRTYLKYLRAFFGFLREEGVIKDDPSLKVKPPKVEQKVLDALSEGEIQKILKADLDLRERALFMVMLDTGLRIEETSSLKKGQFDRARGTIIMGKGRKERYVQISPRTYAILKKYERTVDGPDLWEGRQGNLSVRMIRILVQGIGEKGGVKLNPHKIRRTTTLMMMRKGANIYQLANILGHSDISVLKQYLPLVQADSKEAYDRFSVL